MFMTQVVQVRLQKLIGSFNELKKKNPKTDLFFLLGSKNFESQRFIIVMPNKGEMKWKPIEDQVNNNSNNKKQQQHQHQHQLQHQVFTSATKSNVYDNINLRI